MISVKSSGEAGITAAASASSGIWRRSKCPRSIFPSDRHRDSPFGPRVGRSDDRARYFGFVTLIIPETRMRVFDVAQSHGKRWCGLPGKPQVDKDGAVRRDDRGKIQYAQVLQFLDRDTSEAFGERVIAALLADYPRAFDVDEAAR
jgi:hypothetical protein